MVLGNPTAELVVCESNQPPRVIEFVLQVPKFSKVVEVVTETDVAIPKELIAEASMA